MIAELLKATAAQFKKKFKTSETDFKFADQERPLIGMTVDNPLFEYILDRRFMAYGRSYLTYGIKSSSKTSLFFDLAKMFQRNGGHVIWLETENAADLDYASKQGVDLSKLVLIHPQSLEEALNTAEMFIRNLPKVDPEQTTPLLICLDSIAGSTTEYEQDSTNNITNTVPGTHARILSRFYREIEHPLAQEKCVFLALNQQKVKIGGFSMPGAPPPISMMGGEAPMFSSTYQFQMAFLGDLKKKNAAGVERKFGSKHKVTCKRNKLGREGNSQAIEFDLYINGGVDWYSPLVRMLGENYTGIISRSSATDNTWKIPGCMFVNQDGVEQEIPTNESYHEKELAAIIAASPQAKDIIRDAFEIPAMPDSATVAVVEADMKKKRIKKKKTLDDAENPVSE